MQRAVSTLIFKHLETRALISLFYGRHLDREEDWADGDALAEEASLPDVASGSSTSDPNLPRDEEAR
jgi:hypothetical protein